MLGARGIGRVARTCREALAQAGVVQGSCAAHEVGNESGDALLADCRELLEEVQTHRAELPDWYDALAFRDGALSLQPLHPKHARAWLELCRDGSIAAQTQLPRFDSLQSVEEGSDDEDVREFKKKKWYSRFPGF